MSVGLNDARALARSFVLEEAGFAQLTTLDRFGYPVARSVTAFLGADWSVVLVQRGTHARMAQLRRDPRVLMCWVGDPALSASNERPHVFDIGRLPPRAVMVRGTARFMAADWTQGQYRRHVDQQRAEGHCAAPLRDAAQVAKDLVGIIVVPYRVRLEGFGVGAQSFDWVAAPPDHRFTDTTEGEL